MAKGKKKPEDDKKPAEESSLEKGGKAAANVTILGSAFAAGVQAGKLIFRATGRPVVSLAVGVGAAAVSGIGLSRAYKKATDLIKPDDDKKPDNNKGKGPGNSGPKR